MDDDSLAILRQQTTKEVIPHAHGEAVVTCNLEGSDPLKWTVTVRIFEQLTFPAHRGSFVDGNETQH
jgi:hypothetical protein